jgi:hypothetical protein
MAPKRALLALLVVLLVGTGVAAAVSGEPVLSATLQTDAVAPGEDTTLSMTILNNGSVTVSSQQNPSVAGRVTTARGLEVEVDRDDEAPIAVHAGTFAVGSLPEGGAAPLEVPVSVDEDAEPGTYRVPINVSYRHTSRIGRRGVEETETVRRDLNVTLTVEAAPRFRVHEVTTPLRVGATETVSVTVENVGGAAANDTQVAITSPNAGLTFGGAASATRYVGAWAPGENRTIGVEATAAAGAAPQSYPLEFQATYEGQDGRTKQSESRRLSIRPGPAQPFAVDNVSGTLAVGGEGRLSGTITNSGEEPVRNAVVVFADERATLTPLETEYPVGELGPGESADFSFPIQVSDEAEAGPRQFSVLARYRTDDDTRVESPTMDVRTEIGPKVPAFTVETVDATVVPGGSARLNLTVTNNREEPSTDVSAKLFAESPLSTDDDEAYVDELEPGESAELTFSIAASSAALEKDYPVSLDLRYDEADGDTKTSDTYRRAVTVRETDEEAGTPWFLVGGLVLLVVLVAGYYWTRR